MVATVSGTMRNDHAHAEQQQAVRLDRRKRRRPVGKPDGGNEAAEAEIAQCLLRGRREASDGRLARPQPAAHQAREQGAAGAAERQGERADLHAEQPDEQAHANSRGEKGDIGPVTITHHLADFCRGAFDVVGKRPPAS